MRRKQLLLEQWQDNATKQLADQHSISQGEMVRRMICSYILGNNISRIKVLMDYDTLSHQARSVVEKRLDI